MPFIIPKEGEKKILSNVVKMDDITLHLFINDVTLSRALTSKSFEEPTSAQAYRPIKLASGKWELVQTKDGLAAVHPKVGWEFTGEIGRIFGYFYKQKGTVLFAHRIPDESPFFVKNPQDSLSITPNLRLLRRVNG
jgi:hypothetical protein